MRHLVKLIITLAFFAPTAAQAYYGWVSGTINYYDTRSFTADPGHGPYTHSMKNTWRRLRHVKVYVVMQGSGAVIGSGATDATGRFNIYWYSSVSNPRISINFYFESSFTRNGTPRFRIAGPNGGRWVAWT